MNRSPVISRNCVLAVLAGTLAGHAQFVATDRPVLEGVRSLRGGAVTDSAVKLSTVAGSGGPLASPQFRLTSSRHRPDLRTPLLVRGGLTLVPVGGGGPSPAPAVFQFGVNLDIPDGSLSGLASTQVLPAAAAPVQSVAVTLVLTPVDGSGFLGDLYATLTHEGGGYSVLLNRPGRSASSAFGYSDSLAVNLTVAPDASADIHQYRVTLTGSALLPLTGTLTGRWQPDGRDTDPLAVVTTDPRVAKLESFAGGNQAGAWTLFVADVSGGGQYRLDSWGLAITPVPEPADAAGLVALVALGWGAYCRRRRPEA